MEGDSEINNKNTNIDVINQDEFISEAKEFFEVNKKEISKELRANGKAISIDFKDLSAYVPELAGNLIDRPEETVQLLEVALEELAWTPSDIRVRIINLSSTQHLNIRNLRSKHLGKLISINGMIRRASEIRPLVTNVKFECPSCLPVGTKVVTPNGLKNIEDVDEVSSIDKNFRLINKTVNVVNAGNKKIWKINTIYKSLYSSKYHKWIVYRKGITKVIQTKDIKNGDIIYGIKDKKMRCLSEKYPRGINEEKKENMFLGMQKNSELINTTQWREKEVKRKENNKIISGRDFNDKDSGDYENQPQINKKAFSKIWGMRKDNERAMQDKREVFKYIQAWKTMWGKGIQKNSKKEFSMDMLHMWGDKKQDKGTIGTSQRQESLQQFSREFGSSLRFVPHKVTSVRETKEEVEMYDLQVPDTNNFILDGGIVTHNCGTIISVLQIEREEKQPSRCSCGRRGGFKEITKDMVDSQVLVIEENLDDIEEAGAQPKRINIFLSEDLTDPKMERRIIPGSRVQIIGILKEIRIKSGPSNLNRYDIAIEANNIIPLDEDVSEMEISEEDEEEIKKISLKSDLIEFLSRSIAPSICGYQEVKKALVLQLFGGVNRKRTDGSFCREQIHGLLVGDPGTSKSIILKYISEISYKGRYVSGKSTTAAGITATAIFDENTKAWCLEAGAIVLANKGSIFIDEFDKMDKNDRSNLHEAMEQGTITISKATIQATLSAKTSVLAAANPKFSRFEENSPIGNQINLPPSLLSRFDFIFIMKDLPEEIRDTEIADKIIGEHSEKEVLDILDIKLFKKYIAYAKQFKPDLTKECTNRLKEYYVNLRKRSKRIEGKKIIPLGARQFEGLIRLSEASAKLRLQKTVTKENADEAIEIMETYLRQVGYDEEHDTFDIDKISGNSASQRSKIDLILSTIKELKNQWGKSVEIEVLRSKIGDKINEDEFDEIVEKLIRMGELFRPTRGIIQLI